MLSGGSREDCYAALGIDAERVDDYLGRTLCLEAALHGASHQQIVHSCFLPTAHSCPLAHCAFFTQG